MAVPPALEVLSPRLFVAGLLLVFTIWALKRRSVPGGGYLLAVPVILMVRDAVSVFVPVESVFLGSDLLITGAYLAWLDRYLRRPLLFVLLSAVGVPLVGLRVAAGGAEASLLVRLVTDVVLPGGLYGLLIVAFVEIRELYVPESGPVVAARGPLLAMLAPTFILPMVQGYGSPLVLGGLLPLAYLAHLRPALEYHRAVDRDLQDAIRFRETNIDTLFEFMARVRNAILEQEPVDTVLQYAAETLVRATRSDAGAILVLEEDGRTLRARAVDGFYPPPYEVSEATKKKIGAVEKYFKGRPIDAGETVLGDVVSSRRGVFIPEPERDHRLAAVVKDRVCFMSSFIAVPLFLEGKLYGIASVVRRQNPRRYSRADYDHANVLGEYAAVTLANLLNYIEVLEKEQLESELRMAADIQHHMLPEELPTTPRVDLAAYSVAARNVGGDYYDVVTTEDGLGVLICDVAGKGVPAALVMVMIRTIFRLSQEDSAEPGPVTTWINRGVSGSVDIGRFATLTYVSVDRDSTRLRYANAGHLPALLVGCNGAEPRWLAAEEIPIGIEAGTSYRTREVAIAPGDTLVLYTDGLAEARSPAGEEFGEERIARLVHAHRQEDAQEILDAVRAEVSEFAAGESQHDDQTMVVMKIRGGCE